MSQVLIHQEKQQSQDTWAVLQGHTPYPPEQVASWLLALVSHLENEKTKLEFLGLSTEVASIQVRRIIETEVSQVGATSPHLILHFHLSPRPISKDTVCSAQHHSSGKPVALLLQFASYLPRTRAQNEQHMISEHEGPWA